MNFDDGGLVRKSIPYSNSFQVASMSNHHPIFPYEQLVRLLSQIMVNAIWLTVSSNKLKRSKMVNVNVLILNLFFVIVEY